ncbi:glycoside hydrolase family 43 protein [Spirosoma sp. RP8]|uniref:Glycoside hydrolase family 43 protein n=1 Tax=Spirosoma liriopis TaxID=2937440 RepID=A0ABT0HLA3_9BACT|nr:glycoside hydrolase family 43 protein [Spirosoma liriopis]MCK8492939.1 glycoside hydrolase family 43 protein [Spirosoma liriopis]
MRFICAILVALSTTLHCVAQPTQPPGTTLTYRNPVIAGDFADPSVIRVGNAYYAVGTSSEWGPAYPIYTSTDLVNWTHVGSVFNTIPDWTMGSFWAPELFFRNGTFYVYYTARRKSDKHSYIGVASTRDIRQGFTDHGLLLEWTTEAIDAFVLEEDGKLYITWKAYGLDKGKDIEILGAELAADGLKVTGKAFSMLKAERNNWEGGGAEGQAIVKRGRYYYMTYSGNSCCGAGCNYQVGVARAEKLQGPWVKHTGNPVLVSDQTWKCPGHGTIVTTPDNRYFYLHHAYNGVDFTQTGRQGVLSELVWDDKTQWPTFRYGTTTPAQAESPGKTKQQQQPDLTANFGEKSNDIPWVWDVSSPKPVFSVHDNQLHLTNTQSGPMGSFLGLVIKKGTYTFAADVTPQADVLQSICLYGDASNALGLGVRKGLLELWQIKDGTRTVLESKSIPDDVPSVNVQLISRFGQFYEFSWKPKEAQPQLLTKTPLDGSYLPRWDRAPRIGISVSGAANSSSTIRSVEMKYE